MRITSNSKHMMRSFTCLFVALFVTICPVLSFAPPASNFFRQQTQYASSTSITSTAATESETANTAATKDEGTVAWFNANRGFGFITLENGEDVYVHQSNIVMEGYRKLVDGQTVSCQVGIDDSDRGKGKKFAFDVVPLDDGPDTNLSDGEDLESVADAADASQPEVVRDEVAPSVDITSGDSESEENIVIENAQVDVAPSEPESAPTATAAVSASTSSSSVVTGPEGKAASSHEEDMALTLQVLMSNKNSEE